MRRAAQQARLLLGRSGAWHHGGASAWEPIQAFQTSAAAHQRHNSSDTRARRLQAAAQRRAREADALARQGGGGSSGGVPAAAQPRTVQPSHDAPDEVTVADVVDHPALIVTRAIEWTDVLLGYEVATKYTVYDQDGNVVALMAEQGAGIGKAISRQLLRQHRGFTTTVLSADGTREIFRVRRPAYLINSYMYIEDPQGLPIGEVRQRWHLWQRNYDIFIGRRQFAAINGSFLAWDFELKDERGGSLALIDRNFLGFAKELFTEAGQYVIHFGFSPAQAAAVQQKTLEARSGQAHVQVPQVTGPAGAAAPTDLAVIPTYAGNQLTVARSLTLDERMIALATAISIDYNYFSRRSGGLFSPPIPLIMPIPGGGGAEAGAEAGGAAADAGAAATGGAAAAGEAAGASGAAGPEAGGGPWPGSSEGGSAGAGGEGWGDAGFSSGMGPGTDASGGGLGGGWGQGGDDAGFKWDLGGGEGGGGGGGGEEGGGISGMLRTLWDLFGGGSD